MSNTSFELLKTMRVRLSMIESGLTSPDETVATATKLLVQRLSELPADEAIQVTYTESPLHARYIREGTGEVLAEFRLPSDA